MGGLNFPSEREERYNKRCMVKKIEQQNKDREERLLKRNMESMIVDRKMKNIIKKEVKFELNTIINNYPNTRSHANKNN